MHYCRRGYTNIDTSYMSGEAVDVGGMELSSDPLGNSRALSKQCSYHFSDECRSFAGSKLKQTAHQIPQHPVIPLGTGRPSACFYPWQTVAFETRSSCPEEQHGADTAQPVASQYQMITKHGGPYSLAQGLNYCHALGSTQLLGFITEHVRIVHNPPYADWATSLTCGSTSGLEVALRMFCNRGDTVLAECFTYPGFLDVAKLLGLNVIGVDMDPEGLQLNSLSESLSGLHASQGSAPRLLYTIPSGQNPTGITQSLERKNRIYARARKYDLIIIEDDPYYFLQLESAVHVSPSTVQNDAHEASTAYLAGLSSSYLSLDMDARVIRLDSTSKILAPGLRAGWVTAHREVIAKYIAYHEISTVAVSGPSQLMVWSLLCDTWGHAGFFDWLARLSAEYSSRLDVLLKACEKHLPTKICSWVKPREGMFLWIRLELRQHRALRLQREGTSMATYEIRAIEDRLYARALAQGAQFSFGSMFSVRECASSVLHIRLTYAAAASDDFDRAVAILGQVIREEFDVSV